MRKNRENLIEKLAERLRNLYKWIKNQDWKDPKVILIAITVVIFPFVAWYYISTGLVIGLLLSIGAIYLVEKSPWFIKDFIYDHPLLSDIAISIVAFATLGVTMGSGLTITIGAVIASVLLSWALPILAERYKKEQEERERYEATTATATT